MAFSTYFSGSAALAAIMMVCSCGDSEPSAPAASGAGGSAAGSGAGKGGASAGGAGGSGGTAGATTAGSSSGGTAEGGASAEAGAPSGGMPPEGPYPAVLGEVCPLDSVVGLVELSGFPEPYVQVTLWDSINPWIADPELSTPTCAYHHYTAGGCPTCAGDEMCAVSGECVPQRRTVKVATLQVSTGGMQREYSADPQLGNIYSQLELGTEASKYGMTLKWGETEVVLEPMAVASGKLTNLKVEVEGDSSQPGALDATWAPSTEGAYVRSTIPINHHASGPTFTECGAPDSAGAFHADAAMVDPLAVVTGLEFQGIEHVFVAAAATPQGCVEFRFAKHVFVGPQ